MRFLYYDDWRLGVLRDGQVVDVTDALSAVPRLSPETLINGVIAGYEGYRQTIASAAQNGAGRPLSEVTLRPPLPQPRQIDCMAVNYMEDGTLPAPPPINGFHKSPSAVIGPGGTMVLPDVPAAIFEGEAELALVIGKRATNVAEADAMGHIFGYMNFIDGSAGSATRGQRLLPGQVAGHVCADRPDHRHCRRGPEPAGPRRRADGQRNGDAEVPDQRYGALDPEEPRLGQQPPHAGAGDILATGTNHRGLSAFQDGDQITLSVEGLGTLEFSVRDDLKRTWARTTRSEHTAQGLPGRFTPQLLGKYAPA